jgi:hypothetical protein
MTRGLKLVLLGCLVVLIWSGFSQSKEDTQAAPVMEVEMPTYDFDQVSEGDIVKHDFRVLNRGNAPLEIKDVKPGWGCSVARFDRTIPAGGEGTITLEVKTKGYESNLHKTARVISNDPKASELTIGIKGKVWAPIQLDPRYAGLTGFLGEKIQKILRLRAATEKPLIVKLASVSIPEKVDVELKEMEQGRTWELKVENKVNQETRYAGQVKLTTNYSEKPEMVIRIIGNVRPLVEVMPKGLNFGRLSEEQLKQLAKSGELIRRPVTVVLNKGNDLKVNKLELKNSLFGVVSTEIKPGRTVQLQVQALLGRLKKGPNEDLLKIYTNQKYAQVLEVPIRFEIL